MLAPGTVVNAEEGEELNPLKHIPRVLWENGGLVLSQVKDISGLETAVIQNWIKRGYVAPPVNKHYSQNQTARILSINALRESLKLEHIAKLISFVNGSLIDSSDDLIADSELYDLFCSVVRQLYADNYLPFERIEALAAARTASIENETARQRAKNVLLLMSVCYQSTLIKRRVEGLISSL